MEIKPCPFCGAPSRLRGGPQAQESYSIWCANGHHISGGTSNPERLVKTWNRPTEEKRQLVERLEDILKGDDGQAYKEAERLLARIK